MGANHSVRNSIKFRIGNEENGQIFKALIKHPMETGLRHDRRINGPIPADYIRDLNVYVDDKLCIEMTLNENVSKNPFLTFALTPPINDGQTIRISWIDNLDRAIAHEAVIQFDAKGFFAFEGKGDGKAEPVEIAPLTNKEQPVCDKQVSY